MEDAPQFRCGHPRTPENTGSNKRGRCCLTCQVVCADPERKRAMLRANQERFNRSRGVQEGNANGRKTHCPQDHPYDEENTYVTPAGVRQCKICRRAAMRRDYQKHKERRQADNRAWAAQNVERIAEMNRAWLAANRERANLTSRLKKQRRRAAGTLTAADWQAVLDLYGSACLACGSDDPPTIDHVIPISQGGSNTVDNVQPLCNSCNGRKRAKTIDYRPGAAMV